MRTLSPELTPSRADLLAELLDELSHDPTIADTVYEGEVIFLADRVRDLSHLRRREELGPVVAVAPKDLLDGMFDKYRCAHITGQAS
jgi:hypothetical protein